MFTPLLKKLLTTKGASLIQVMVIVGVMGIMTGVFIQEADLQNKQTYGIRKKGETDELLNEIRLQLGNPTNVADMLVGTQTASSGSVTLPFALSASSVAVSGINFTVATPAVGTLNPPIEPNEVIYTLDIAIRRNAAGSRGMNIASVVNRQLTLRVFRDATAVYTGYTEESEAYYARIFCKMVGGRILGNGQCDNQFEAKSCLMMGGRWIPDANGLLTPPMSAIGTCEKGKDTCAWLTKPELAADDPLRYECWNAALNKCEFPTAGTWTTVFTNPPQVTNPWKACADGPDAGATVCERQKDPECIEGFCNGNCIDAPPTGLFADAQFGAAKPAASLTVLAYGQNPNTVSNFTTYTTDSLPPTCAVYGQYVDSPAGSGPWACDTTLNDCYEALNCTGYSCISSSANYCDPSNTSNSPVPLSGSQYSGSMSGSGGRRYDPTILNSGGPYAGGTCGVNWSGSVTWSGSCNSGTCRETGTMSCNSNGCGNCALITPPAIGGATLLSYNGTTANYDRACVINATWPAPSFACSGCVEKAYPVCGAQCGGTCSGLDSRCTAANNNGGTAADCTIPQGSTSCGDVNGGWSAKIYGTTTFGSCSAVCPTTTGTRSVSEPWTLTCTNPTPTCDGITCSGASSGTDSSSEACSTTCAPAADCQNGVSCSITACTGGTCSGSTKRCQRTVERDAGNDCGDMDIIIQNFIATPATCTSDSDCPATVNTFPSGKCSDGGNVADGTMVTDYACITDTSAQTCGGCLVACTPSCPATSTYCAGDEPSDGCSGTCPTGTKSSGCGDCDASGLIASSATYGTPAISCSYNAGQIILIWDPAGTVQPCGIHDSIQYRCESDGSWTYLGYACHPDPDLPRTSTCTP